MNTFYKENAALVTYWARRYAVFCENRGDIDFEDLIQAGFIGALTAIKGYDPSKAAWSTWSAFHVRNAIRDALGIRSGRRDPSVLSLDAPAYSDADCDVSLGETVADDSLPAIDEALLLDDIAREIRRAVDALPENQRAVIRGIFFDKLSRTEIANTTGLRSTQIGGVRTRALVALARRPELRNIAYCEELDYISHKSPTAFIRDRTSDTERLAILSIEKNDRLQRQQKG